eukprot:1142011-Pelagomonas_calceolata.AAC.6
MWHTRPQLADPGHYCFVACRASTEPAHSGDSGNLSQQGMTKNQRKKAKKKAKAKAAKGGEEDEVRRGFAAGGAQGEVGAEGGGRGGWHGSMIDPRNEVS